MLFLNKNLISIDIGTSCVKMIELTGRSTKTVKTSGVEVLEPGIVVNGRIEDQPALVAALNRLAKKLKIITKGRRCALSLGGNSIVVKRALLENINDEMDLNEQVRYEAEQHFQYDLEELFFDYYPMKEFANDTGTPVIICGAKQEIVQSYIEAVRELGMRVGVIDSDVLCLANMFQHNYGEVQGLSAIVNVGASGTSVSLMFDGQYLYTREIPTGGDYYTSQISESLGIDKNQAENLKVTAASSSGETPQDLMNALGEINEQLVNEIGQCVDFYFQSGEAPQEVEDLENIFLVGGGARVLGLDAALAAKNNVPVNVLNPFHKIEVNSKKIGMDYILTQGHLYGVSVGLGLREMND
jgi:type IV pilus assembly protein PilM